MTCRSQFPLPQAALSRPSEASEANHRIANSLSLAAAQLRAERRDVSDAFAIGALRRAEARLLAIAGFHASLYRDGADRVDFVARLSERLPVIGEALGVDCTLAIEEVGAALMTNERAMRLMTAVSALIMTRRSAAATAMDGAGST